MTSGATTSFWNDIYSSLWYQQNTHLVPAGRNEKNFRSPTLVS